MPETPETDELARLRLENERLRCIADEALAEAAVHIMLLREQRDNARADVSLLAAFWYASERYRCDLRECRPCRAMDAAREAAERYRESTDEEA